MTQRAMPSHSPRQATVILAEERRTRDDIWQGSLLPAFVALRSVVERVTQRSVDECDLGAYSAPERKVFLPRNDVEGLVHELAHWAMAAPDMRVLDNWGLETARGYRVGYAQEIMCGWVQEDLYLRAGVDRPMSSVDEVDFAGYPWLRRAALRRWRRSVGWSDRLAVVDALRLPGGDVGLHDFNW